ncbi:hypothetical protein RPE78_14730 (plasmid) [Thioclava litoralis]|uniref:Transposase n=1 Tax=Thioclava litoralis TaxID=3076557 RepID=A0ABZ1E564_9RHOB|nr:hypothetical protein RPE78_14730 [Thioclava sp. FTW29]
MNDFPKIRNHYGFAIELHPGGRRVWPPSFKRFIREKIETGQLSVEEVREECRVSKSLVYKWRDDVAKGRVAASAPEYDSDEPLFSEILVQNDEPLPTGDAAPESVITLSGEVVNLTLPANYPLNDLVVLIQTLERG